MVDNHVFFPFMIVHDLFFVFLNVMLAYILFLFLPCFSPQGNPGANGLNGAKGAAVSMLCRAIAQM